MTGQTIKGHVNSPDDVDYFRFEVPEPGVFEFTLDSEIPGLEISLQDENGNILAADRTESRAEFILALRVRATLMIISCTLKPICVAAVHEALTAAVAPEQSNVLTALEYVVAVKKVSELITEGPEIRPDAPVRGSCRCWATVEPGGESKEISFADFIRTSSGNPPIVELVQNSIQDDLRVTLDEGTGRAKVSAPRGARLGLRWFRVRAYDSYTDTEGRVVPFPIGKEFPVYVNVQALPSVLPGKRLIIRAEPGRKTTIDLDDFIGPPEHVGYPPRIRFQILPGMAAGSVDRLKASIDPQTNRLSIQPPSDLRGEFHLPVAAKFDGIQSEHELFTFQVIVGKVVGPRLIEGGPPLLVSVEQGGEVMIRLTDHIEDSEGGRLTFAPASLPPGLGVARNGPDWTIRAPRGARLGEHVITLTATNGNGLSADFVLRVVVEEAGADPFPIGEPPSDVAACLATLETSLQELYDQLAQIGTTTVAVCKTAYCPEDAVRCNCCSTVDNYVRANPARDVSVDGFLFDCTVDNPGVPPLTLSGVVGSPIGEHFSIATRADQNICRTTIDNRRTECRHVLNDELLPDIERFAPTFESCRRIFNAQVQDCESHFDGQRQKCGG